MQTLATKSDQKKGGASFEGSQSMGGELNEVYEQLNEIDTKMLKFEEGFKKVEKLEE